MRVAAFVLAVWFPLFSVGCSRNAPGAEQDWDEIARHLPPHIKLSMRLSQPEHKKNVIGDPTVKDELIKLGAHVKDGKLLSRSGKGIRFFDLTLPGVQTKGTEAKLEADQKEIESLRERYEVIVIEHLGI